MRPEYVESPAFLDVRVRKALRFGVDAAAALDVVTAGKGILTYTLTSPRVESYSEIEQAVEKYPYDPKRAQQLMGEAGFVKGTLGLGLPTVAMGLLATTMALISSSYSGRERGVAFGAWGLIHPRSLTELLGDDPELGRLLGARDMVVGLALFKSGGPLPLAMRLASDDWSTQVSELVEKDAKLRKHIAKLEQAYDEELMGKAEEA